MNEAKWAEVNLDALAHNMRQIRKKVGPDKRIAAVIKANGYGHGALEIADTFLAAGADQFAVSFLDEAKELRRKYAEQDILVLGAMPEEAAEEAILLNLQQTVTSVQGAKAISEAAVKLNQTARIHIKLDTGMSRVGFQMTEEDLNDIETIRHFANLNLEGIFTHFATADEADKTFAKKQLDRFKWFVASLEKRGIFFSLKHTSNSAAIMELSDAWLNMVRPGIVQYGVYPSDQVDKKQLDIQLAMSFKARISHIKVLKEDSGISYGQKYTAKAGSVIATIPVGYADGYTRALSGKAEVLYKGKKVPVLGNICMDQCMLDISDIEDPQVGDEVVLFGFDHDNCITPDEVGSRYGTIGYEVLCAVSHRVPRIYMKNGEIVRKVSYLL